MQLESDQKIQSYWLQITVDLLILYWASSKCLSIDSAFCCWFVDFEMAENWKVLVTGCKTLLICWFVELLSCWVVELLSCWAVDLLSHLLVIFLMVVLDPKIQSYRSQNTVDLLILYWVSSQCLSIDSAFSRWFVDFWNGSF